MLFVNGYPANEDPSIRVYEDSAYRVFYKGLIYVAGKKCGEDSIKTVLTGIGGLDIKHLDKVRGNFIISIQDKSSGFRYIFTDNSGMYRLYVSENIVSTSFLELVRFRGFKKENLNRFAVAEFFLFGFVYAGNTFIESVRVMERGTYFVYDKNDLMHVVDKEIPSIRDKTDMNIIDFFRDFYASAKGSRISMDLTGGNDTRLITSIMNGIHADFELGISGIAGIKDVEIPTKIARALNREIVVTYHRNDLTGDLLRELYNITDATMNCLQYHRNHQYNTEKRNRGIDIHIHGGGGPLYNDIYWLQDFPFYNSRSTNIRKLFRWRFNVIQYPFYNLAGEYRELALTVQPVKIERLEKLKLETNTQTYDNICWNYTTPALSSLYATINGKYNICYLPLLELDLVRILFNLPRRSRFYNNFHREYITWGAPEISRMLNTIDVSTSSRVRDKFLDIPRYIFNMEKRLLKKVLQKTVKKTYMQESPDNPDVLGAARKLPLVREQITKLKELNILSKNVEPALLANAHLGRFVTFGLFLDELK